MTFLNRKAFIVFFIQLISIMTNQELTYADQKALYQLVKILDSSYTTQASFEQISRDKEGNIFRKTDGNILLKNPGRFYWHLKAPDSQIIILNNKKLLIWDLDLDQVIVKNIDKSVNSLTAFLLEGNFKKVNQFYNVTLRKNKKNSIFTLEPREGDRKKGFQFTSIVLIFRQERICEIRINDIFKQSTQILFSSVRINQSIPEKKFNPIIPKGIDIIQD